MAEVKRDRFPAVPKGELVPGTNCLPLVIAIALITALMRVLLHLGTR